MTETVAALLLTRQWFDRDDGVRLTFWAASERGPLKLVFTQQESVLFLDRHTPSSEGRRGAVDLKSLAGRPVDAVYFKTQRALRRERARLRETGARTLEGDVKAHDRFLMERFVTGGLVATGEFRRRDGYLEVINPRLKSSEYTRDLSVLAFDIETVGLDGPLLSIGVAGVGGEHVWMVGAGPGGPALSHPEDEAGVLRSFLAHVATTDPDILVGWNVVDFDLSYLQRKAAELKVPLSLGRGGERARVLPGRTPQQPTVAVVPGRVVLDGIATLRSATHTFESFRLQDVAQSLLGKGKKIEHSGDPVAEIQRLYLEDKPALAEYNLQDCRLVLEIFEAADLVGFALERQALTGLPMNRQGGSVAAFDNLYLPRLHRSGYVAPEVGDSGPGVRSPGGYVMNSVPGLYDNVLVLDFKSLYPSIIRTFAIDPLGMAVPGEDPIPGFDEAAFAREGHILPGLIEALWSARDEAKRRKDLARSQAVKILMNSFYGVLGSSGCRFFSTKLASSITLRGHEILLESRRFIESRGLKVIYGDTDSLFVHAGGDQADCRDLGESLARDLNTHWTERLSRDFKLPSRLEVEFETHYLRFLMPTMRGSEKGSKKRYAGTVRRGSELDVVIKGLEAARSDWTPLARRLQRELLMRVFTGEPWRAWLGDLARGVRAGKFDDELVYRKRIRRKLGDYQKNVAPHIQAARLLGRPVREIRYVVTVRGPEPAELPHAALDYRHYLTKQLAPAADCVLPFLGTSFSAVGGVQLSLFE